MKKNFTALLLINLFISSSLLAQSIEVTLIDNQQAVIKVGNSLKILKVGDKYLDFSLLATSNNAAKFKFNDQVFWAVPGAVYNFEENKKLLKLSISQEIPTPENSYIQTINVNPPQHNKSSSTPSSVLIRVNSRNQQFITDGLFQGLPVKYLLDTGANAVAISIEDANRLQVDYRKGRKAFVDTVGGKFPAYYIKAKSISVGNITLYDVDTIVTEKVFADTNTLLLGQSFLAKVRLVQEGDTMTIEAKK